MNSQKTTVAAGIAMLVLAGGAAFGLFRNTRPDNGAPVVGNSNRTRQSQLEASFYQQQSNQRLAVDAQQSSPVDQSRQIDPQPDVRGNQDGKLASSRHPSANPTSVVASEGPANSGWPSVAASADEVTANGTRSIARVTGSISNQNSAIPATPDPTPHKSVASVLSATLTDSELSDLGAHEMAAVVELGAFDEEPPENHTTPPQAGASTSISRSVSSVSDGYLRATLGHNRFNQLSFLASFKRRESGIRPAPLQDASAE